ncbi:hypothetical protein SK128_021182 [Halocaridina rubra]|uniref:CHK kinase-like domain-containing protein n=1 Tax=Halocaridina rubra TaxID=373956 RepID=A0AAN8XNZ3_HALRR
MSAVNTNNINISTYPKNAGDSTLNSSGRYIVDIEKGNILNYNNDESATFVKEEHVRNALKRDKGPEASLIWWGLQEFMDQGATASIKRVQVQYKIDNEVFETSYIAKMNLGASTKSDEKKTLMYFKKEELFFTELAPVMREVLNRMGRPLRTPRCYENVINPGKELTIMEDLSRKGFKLAKGDRNLNIEQSRLAMQEMAVFHAASLIIEKEIFGTPLEEKYTILKEKWFEGHPHRSCFHDWWSKQLYIIADLAHKKGEAYQKHTQWLQMTAQKVIDELVDSARPSHPKFSVLIHNDIWFNNILFRNNKQGSPIEAMLVDLQMVSKASCVIDMVFFMFVSMNNQDRLAHWEALLSTYYISFKQILEEFTLSVPFTFDELREEFLLKTTYGVIFGLAFCAPQYYTPETMVRTPRNEEEWQSYAENYKKSTVIALKNPTVAAALEKELFERIENLNDFGVI